MEGGNPLESGIRFEFATATRIRFGRGVLAEVAPAVAGMGRRVFLVTGRSTDRSRPLAEDLTERGCEVATHRVTGEPTVDAVRAAVDAALEHQADVVIAMGGGSVIDAGKAVAILLTNPGPMTGYLEVIGEGRPLTEPGRPCVAIPTTAGTGAEVTRNSVLGVPDHGVKVSLRSPLMLPRLAVIDPALTDDLPLEITAYTGMDALTQLLEAFVSRRANPLTDGICREGLRRAARSLEHAWRGGEVPEAREDMALASLFGGLALANSRLGAVHGLAAPIGGAFPAPHGAVCARLLPPVLAANLDALADGPSALRNRFDELAAILTENPDATAADGVDWVRRLAETLRIPGLARYGLTESAVDDLVDKAGRSSSIRGNPVDLTPETLAEVVRRAL